MGLMRRSPVAERRVHRRLYHRQVAGRLTPPFDFRAYPCAAEWYTDGGAGEHRQTSPDTLGDNSEGWVETRFITQEKPVKMMLLNCRQNMPSSNVWSTIAATTTERNASHHGTHRRAGRKSGNNSRQQNGSMRREDGEAGEGVINSSLTGDCTAENASRKTPAFLRKLETDTQLRTTISSPGSCR